MRLPNQSGIVLSLRDFSENASTLQNFAVDCFVIASGCYSIRIPKRFHKSWISVSSSTLKRAAELAWTVASLRWWRCNQWNVLLKIVCGWVFRLKKYVFAFQPFALRVAACSNHYRRRPANELRDSFDACEKSLCTSNIFWGTTIFNNAMSQKQWRTWKAINNEVERFHETRILAELIEIWRVNKRFHEISGKRFQFRKGWAAHFVGG